MVEMETSSSAGDKFRFRPQFTAVILTNDDDNSLYPLTNELPKSLLPVANRPILKYQLDLLSSSGFTDVIVVTTRDWYPRVSQFIVNEYRGELRVDLVQVDNDFGTADMLRAVAKKIRTHDVLVLDGGVIVGKHLHDVLDLHRVRQADVTLLLKNAPGAVDDEPLDKSKKKKGPAEDEDEDEIEFFGIVPTDNRVVLKIPSSAVEQQQQDHSQPPRPLRLSRALLRRVSRYTLRSNLIDSCLYVMSRWILQLLEGKEDSFSSLDQDLVPYVIRQQFKGPEVLAKYVKDPIGPSEDQTLIAKLSSGTPVLTPDDGVRCYAHILPSDQSLCLKITSTPSYLAANRDMMGSVPMELAAWAPLEGLRRKESVLMGEGSEMGDKVNVRMSVIGAGCKIGSRVKINGCVIMDNAVIADGCTLQGTIVCNNATVEEDCSLTDCYVGALVTIPAKTKQKEEEFLRD